MISSRQQPTATVTAVKGHLVTKSSALAATGNCKLEKQFITAQNMASHYKRVINARPSIDTQPPKSMLTSQIARDRAKREMLNYTTVSKSQQRAKSAESRVHEQDFVVPSQQTVKSARNFDETKPRPLPNQEKLNKEMSQLMANFTKSKPSARVMTYRTSESDEFSKSHPVQQLSSRKSEDRSKNQMGSSLFFNSHNDSRSSINNPALKSTSRLVANTSYDVLENHAHKFKQPDKDFQPRIKNREKASSSLLEKSSCYQPPRRRNPNKSATSTARAESSQDFENTYKPMKPEKSIDDDKNDISKKMNESLKNIEPVKSFTDTNISLKKAAQKEEDIKYLAFIKEVTDDIISRGISSNRVINNCFEYHIKQNRHDLSERKMRELLVSLREDLGIPTEEESETNEKYHKSVKKALSLDKERNKENLDTDLNGSQYMTLRKFGWTASDQNRSLHDVSGISGSLNNSRTNWKSNDENDDQIKTSSRRNSDELNQLRNKKDSVLGDYENQIIKNIQSIRRNSLGKSSGHSSDSNSYLNESQKLNKQKSVDVVSQPTNDSKHSSILKKSTPSPQTPEPDSNTDKYNKTLSKTNSAEDDDDDIFTGHKNLNQSRQTNQILSNPSLRNEMDTSQNKHNESKLNESKNQENFNLTVKPKNATPTKSEFSDDILFNDDYGAPEDSENDDFNKPSIQNNNHHSDEDEDDDDNFDQLLKTKTFHKSELDAYKNTMREQDDESDEDTNQSPTPRAAPRKSLEQPKYKDLESDDDEF